MKFHKLVKSIDYVTYPSYVELKKINKKLGDSYSSIQNILISAFIGFFLEKTMIFNWIANFFLSNTNNEVLKNLLDNDNINRIAALLFALIVYSVLMFIRFADSRWGSNKDTLDERKDIVFTFYRCIVPNLIALKSIIQQHDESEDKEYDKKYLLLLQAHHEIYDLFEQLNNINVVEFQKEKKKHKRSNDNIHSDEEMEIEKNSKDVLDQIGADTYLTVLKDLLIISKDLFEKTVQLKQTEKDDKQNNGDTDKTKNNLKTVSIEGILDSLNACVVGSKAISASKGLKDYPQVSTIVDLDKQLRILYRAHKKEIKHTSENSN